MLIDILFLLCAAVIVINGILLAWNQYTMQRDEQGWKLYEKERGISDRTYEDLMQANKKIKELERENKMLRDEERN